MAPSWAPGTAQVCARKQKGGHLPAPEWTREGCKQPRLAWMKCDPDQPVPKTLPRGSRCEAFHDVVTNLFPPLPTPSPEPQPRDSPTGHTVASPRDLKKTPISAWGTRHRSTTTHHPRHVTTCDVHTWTSEAPTAPLSSSLSLALLKGHPASSWPHCTRQNPLAQRSRPTHSVP